MKGIILAGGKGTRLYPMTQVISKQLLPLYDKPMIYYPLSVLMLAGIKDILIISTPSDLGNYRKLLGDGSRLGLSLSYAEQAEPKGLAEAFIIGEEFIGNDDVCLILGDNVFYGQDLTSKLRKAMSLIQNDSDVNAVIFGYPVKNPQDFGVVEFDSEKNVVSIEEKPSSPKSNYVVPGLYFYSNSVVNVSKTLTPSKRGELEITAVNNVYLQEGSLKVNLFGRGFAWLDTGTPHGMLKAAEFIETVQSRQGFYVSCPEEIAWRRGFITKEQMLALGEELKMTDYGQYLLSLGE
jgi:glucose-1-phosphate thymidylyltransferase